ncbi:hypothetical protein M115_2780 [Bacteroides fragilis str. 3719 T6]|uniref:Uncharacterized protein n=1 Tax=Bacteroides fragilis str. 2-F-2 \|nr:hypothetical protein M077_3215 [Bacteroides fragilis str. 2-F-2 \
MNSVCAYTSASENKNRSMVNPFFMLSRMLDEYVAISQVHFY